MYKSISDSEALIHIKELYKEYFDSSQLIIFRKLENNRYVTYYTRDERYGKDFSQGYFGGGGIGFIPDIVYDKHEAKFLHTGGLKNDNSKVVLEDFFQITNLKLIISDHGMK